MPVDLGDFPHTVIDSVSSGRFFMILSYAVSW